MAISSIVSLGTTKANIGFATAPKLFLKLSQALKHNDYMHKNYKSK